MLEWRAPEGTPPPSAPPRARNLSCHPTPSVKEERFPLDPLIRYFNYVDSGWRHSTVGFIEYGARPGRSAQLVEQCSARGIPVVVWFETPPDRNVPFLRQILGHRSIERPDDGLLRWQPVLSWKCDREEGFSAGFLKWFKGEEPIFPPPLVRIAFASNLSPAGGELILNELRGTVLPCRFKLISLPLDWEREVEDDKWIALLDSLYPIRKEDAPGQKVIDLFPERQKG